MHRLAIFLFSLLAATSLAAQTKPFYLHQDDRVVFYGDSITEQRLYTTFTESAIHAIYPQLHITFFNAGVGGDRVSGGGCGPIDERLERDVIAHKPTVVTIMLGMNDRVSDKTRKDYRSGYEHILQRLQKALPGVRLFLLAPSPFDDVTRSRNATTNQQLVDFAATVKQLAAQYHTGYLDWNEPLHAALQRATEKNREAATLALPDHVHPTDGFHLLMSDLLLRAWGVPEIITLTSLDAQSRASSSTEEDRPTEIHSLPGGGLQWTELDHAAMHYQDAQNGSETLYRLLTSTPSPARRMLRITNLPAGSYQLRIDNTALPTVWDANALAHGVDLSQESTPMLTQAHRIYYASADAELLQSVSIRLLARIHELPQPDRTINGDPLMVANLALAQRKISDASEPQRHTYSLSRLP